MLNLGPEFFAQMTAHARSGLPNESCGLFAGTIDKTTDGEEKTVTAIYCLKNTDESPEHFSMAPEDQFNAIKDIRKQGLSLLGNFHSHPATPARPSEEDIRLAFDPSLSYIIISLKDAEPVLKSFSIRGGVATEEPVKV
ncbi:Mov34/MPN/PAD-1 family protein [Spirochaetia bacterium]|nr:Mov34/MPN/PAD-1 family protein [Spirochaetia bacterium]